MGIPQISLLAANDTDTVSSWNAGTVKANTTSKPLEVHVWNNHAGSQPGTNMIECTVGAFDSNGKDVEPIASGKWIQVQVNDEMSGGSPKFTPIGGTVTAPIRAVGHPAVPGDPVTGDVIEAGTNDGKSATEASKKMYSKCVFQIAVPASAAPGTTGFKIRFQGYYI